MLCSRPVRAQPPMVAGRKWMFAASSRSAASARVIQSAADPATLSVRVADRNGLGCRTTAQAGAGAGAGLGGYGWRTALPGRRCRTGMPGLSCRTAVRGWCAGLVSVRPGSCLGSGGRPAVLLGPAGALEMYRWRNHRLAHGTTTDRAWARAVAVHPVDDFQPVPAHAADVVVDRHSSLLLDLRAAPRRGTAHPRSRRMPHLGQ